MKEIARHKQQITLYYNPNSSLAKKTLAFLQESEVPVLTIDLLKNPPKGSHWIEIANALGIAVSDLVLKNHPVFLNQYSKSDLNLEDWLKIMHHHPEVIDQPIAIRGDKTVLINTPTDILQLLKAKV